MSVASADWNTRENEKHEGACVNCRFPTSGHVPKHCNTRLKISIGHVLRIGLYGELITNTIGFRTIVVMESHLYCFYEDSISKLDTTKIILQTKLLFHLLVEHSVALSSAPTIPSPVVPIESVPVQEQFLGDIILDLVILSHLELLGLLAYSWISGASFWPLEGATHFPEILWVIKHVGIEIPQLHTIELATATTNGSVTSFVEDKAVEPFLLLSCPNHVVAQMTSLTVMPFFTLIPTVEVIITKIERRPFLSQRRPELLGRHRGASANH